ncbi:MAG: sensor domain-containing diguanylate cyclase [Thermodesulfovibrionales bacterium]|nr:sensor domain-containing diguanylate cyclase [Thermodesulfovibrionales bacterium]
MKSSKERLTRAVDFVTFSDMPIKKKFLIFCSGVGAWFLLIAGVGIFSADNMASRIMIAMAAMIAIALLLFFAYWFSRSMTRPINAMIDQIESISEGEIDLSKKILITSKDEIGELSGKFNKLLEAIHDMNFFKKVIEEDDTPQDIYIRLGTAFDSLGLKSYQIYEVSNSKNTMRAMNSGSGVADETCKRDMLVNSSLCRAKRTGDIVSSLSYPGICKHFLGSPEQQYICVPMIIGDSTGGVTQFIFENSEVHKDMHKHVLRAQKYIKEALPVLEAKRLMDTLKESSLRDPMTGLYNRRFLEEYSETLVATTHRRGTNIGLLMCDLDFFKEVNDTYGHNVGDAVLRETSNIIRDSVRASDMVVRFGGEEFLAVLQDIKDGESRNIAEKIRKKIEETKIKMPKGFIQKTISIGIAEFPKDTPNFWQSIKYADIALYKAKDSGRNLTVRFTKDMWTSEGY